MLTLITDRWIKRLYRIAVYSVASIHMIILIGNTLAVPYLLVYERWFIWLPIITVLVSPIIGGAYCMFNRLENYYRLRADMPMIEDRWSESLSWFIKRLS